MRRSFYRAPSAAVHPRPGAFTLVEVLVAAAVLGLLMVILLQVVNSTLQSTRIVTDQMDSSDSARRALDVLAADLSRAASGTETGIVVSEPFRAALLLPGRGPSTSTKTVRWLAVAHRLDGEALHRDYSIVDWAMSDPINQATLASSAGGSDDSGGSILLKGLLGLVATYRFANGTSTNFAGLGSASAAETEWNGQTIPPGWKVLFSPTDVNADPQRVVSIELTAACIDGRNLALLEQTGTLADLKAEFAKSIPAGRTAEEHFDSIPGTMAGIPAPARSAIRTISRSLPLP